MPTPPAPDFELVRQRLVQARKAKSLSLRAVADASEVSAATLSRFESRKGNPDLATLSKLVDWLRLDRGAVFHAPTSSAPVDTPQVVEVHLRADPKLDPRTARALAEGFRTLYEQFTRDDSDGPVPERAAAG